MTAQTWKQQTNYLLLRALDKFAPRAAANHAFQIFTTPRARRTSERDQDIMNAAERLNSTYTDQSLVGYAWGRGATILLVHGWEGSARNFTRLVKPLVNAGFRVVAFDAPAHGNSDGSSSNMIEYSKVLAALITEFGPVHGVIAHSMGGAAAVLMMGTIKHFRIQRLVLVNAPCEFSDVMARFANFMRLSEKTMQHMGNLIHKRLGIPVSALSTKALIPFIGTPGLVIHDVDDPVIPFSDGETIAAHWPEAEFIVTEKLGHNGALRHAETIDLMVNFMAEPQPQMPIYM